MISLSSSIELPIPVIDDELKKYMSNGALNNAIDLSSTLNHHPFYSSHEQVISPALIKECQQSSTHSDNLIGEAKLRSKYADNTFKDIITPAIPIPSTAVPHVDIQLQKSQP